MKITIDDMEFAFPTLVRYAGLLSTLILMGFSVAGYYVETAPGFVAAGGMILYKTVHESSKSKDRDE